MKELSLRTIARIQAMEIIYMSDLNEISLIEAMNDQDILDNDELLENKELLDYAKDLINFVIKNLADIDKIIEDTLFNYKLNRLNLVDKAIIRVAVAEMLINKLDAKIIIDEALEITKLYSDTGDHKAVSFNNRLLDNISKNIKR
jgi:N utilization substance protein B